MISAATAPRQHPYEDIPETLRRMTPVTDFFQIQDALGSRDFAMGGRDQSMPFFHNTLITKESDEHSAERRALGRHFRPAFLVDYVDPHVQEAFRLFVDPLTAGIRDGEPVIVELVDLVFHMQTLIMARFLGLSLEGDVKAAVHDLAGRMPLVNKAGALLWSRNEPIAEMDKVRHAVVEFNDRYVMPGVRRALEKQDGEPTTFIETLVEAFDPTTSDGEWIAREARVFITAGVRTTAISVLDTIPYLIDWYRTHPESIELALDPTNDFLIRAVSETLRINVSSPAIIRKAVASGQTKHGLRYEAGESFALYTGISHLDEAVFGPEPEAFNPDRVPLEGVPLWGHAFGHGHHACIGRALALGRPRGDATTRSYEGAAVSMIRRLTELGVGYVPGRDLRYKSDTFKRMCEEFPAYLGGGQAAASARVAGTRQ
jgi:cytochrome P450